MEKVGHACESIKIGQVEEQLQELSNAIYSVNDLLSVLRERLSPVLDFEDKAEKAIDQPVCSIAPLADNIRSLRFKTEKNKAIIQEILSTLQL